MASVPNIVAADWVCPLGKEYPVAPARADSTMVKEGSSTQGLGMRKMPLSSWFITLPVSPVSRKRNPQRLLTHHRITKPATMNTVSSPSSVTAAIRLSSHGVRRPSSHLKIVMCVPPFSHSIARKAFRRSSGVIW